MGFTCRKQYLLPTFHNRRSTFVIIREQFFQILGNEKGNTLRKCDVGKLFLFTKYLLNVESEFIFYFNFRKLRVFLFEWRAIYCKLYLNLVSMGNNKLLKTVHYTCMLNDDIWKRGEVFKNESDMGEFKFKGLFN